MAALRFVVAVLSTAALSNASILSMMGDSGDWESDSGKTKTTPTTKEPRSKTTDATKTAKTRSTGTHTTSTEPPRSFSTTAPHVYGGETTDEAFLGWLSVWRSKYERGLWHAGVGDPWESMLPEALKEIEPLVVMSEGGVAAGVVTEGMGYGIMVEGFQAAKGSAKALQLGLQLTKSWLAMVAGPGGKAPEPYAGGADFNGSATNVDFWPYGVSAVEWSHDNLGASGLPAWKYPIKLCQKGEKENCMGSATDGDQDAVLGMIYLAGALGYPEDFVDMVMRTIISFASADLGFPDLYRTLPNGEMMFVPKGGSMWGGLLPPGGKYKTKQQPWCYSPGYFAPAHYRTFRDFVAAHWHDGYNDYLPRHLDGKWSTQLELMQAFDGTVSAGYNILYYSSCSSGSVANWVGVEAACDHNDTLNCPGVPWAHTPYVGASMGECSQSGTDFGSFGADASRTAWRVAMDYALYREESTDVAMYDRDGHRDDSIYFGAQAYLNRIVTQYKYSSDCDGGIKGDCMNHTRSPYKLAHAFETKHSDALNCSNVPNPPESWWAGFMSYPTFTAFIAPYHEIPEYQMAQWMDTFSSICNFSNVNFWNYTEGGEPEGKICLTKYFEASQAVISTMIMSGSIVEVPQTGELVILKAESFSMSTTVSRLSKSGLGMFVIFVAGVFGAAVILSSVVKLSVGIMSGWRLTSRAARLLPRPYAELQDAADTLELEAAIEAADRI